MRAIYVDLEMLKFVYSSKYIVCLCFQALKTFQVEEGSMILSRGSWNNDKYILTQNKEGLSKIIDYDLRRAWTQARAAWLECINKIQIRKPRLSSVCVAC